MGTSECRLCVLDAKRFQKIVSHFEHTKFDPKVYAHAFVKDMNAYTGVLLDILPWAFGSIEEIRPEKSVMKTLSSMKLGTTSSRSSSNTTAILSSIKSIFSR